MFDQPLFQARKFKLVRYFVPWNIEQNKDELALATAYVERARRDHIQVLLHISSDDLRIKRAKLPSVAQYSTQIKKIVATFRPLGRPRLRRVERGQPRQPADLQEPHPRRRFLRRGLPGDQAEVQLLQRRRARRPRPGRGRAVHAQLLPPPVLDLQAARERSSASTTTATSTASGRRSRRTSSASRASSTRRRGSGSRRPAASSSSARSFPCNKERAKNRLKNMFSLARTYRTSGVERLYVYNWSAPAERVRRALRRRPRQPRWIGRAPATTTSRSALPNYER